jgi:recombination protein RecA
MGALRLLSKDPAFRPLEPRPQPETLSLEADGLDDALFQVIKAKGLPRGAVTEIVGAGSRGQTALLFRILAQASKQNDLIAYIDASNALDIAGADRQGLPLQQLLWIQGGNDTEACLNAALTVLQAGGFGVVVLDLKDSFLRNLRGISISYWHKLRLAAERTSSVVTLMSPENLAGSAAAVTLDTERISSQWRQDFLRGFETQVLPRKGHQSAAGPHLRWRIA